MRLTGAASAGARPGAAGRRATPPRRSRPAPRERSLILRPDSDDVVLRSPECEVAALNGGGHHVWEEVGRAGEARTAQAGERRRVARVEAGRALIVQRQQADHLDTAGC